MSAVEMALVWQVLHEDPACPSRVVLAKVAQRQVPMAVSIRHLNGLRAKWHLNRRTGRPGHTALHRLGGAGGVVVQVTPHLSFVGVHLFAPWLDQQAAVGPVVAQLQQGIEAQTRAHPDDDLPLWHHRAQTLLRRFQALFFAPLVGGETLTAFDTHEHPLQTLLGRGYPSATRTQCLGQLERIDAARALRPALVPHQVGHIAYVDGPMMAYWSRVPMHKGTITMRGRIMAGSQAVITHDDAGQGLFGESHPPDMHLSQCMVDSCQPGAMATAISVCVIDRAVNAVAMARAFAHQDFGLLCRLDDNEHHGLESCEATVEETRQDGTQI